MDAYGYNALSGFFGSSSRKQKRKDDIAYLTQIYNLQQQQQQAEQQNQLNSQKIIDDAFSIAQQLTTGENARQKDLDAINNYNKENNIIISFKLQPDPNLKRGDLRIKSGSINLGDIVSNKINFSESNDLDLNFENLDQTTDYQSTDQKK